MSSAEQHLRTWQKAGLLDHEQAERIRAFEAGRGRRDEPEEGRPGLLEALLYLGVVVASVGIFTLIAQNWDQLQPWARFLVLALPCALLLAAGAAMQRLGSPAIARAGGVAWMVSVALLAGAVGVAGNNLDWDDEATLLVAALAAVPLAALLWAQYPSHTQVVTLAGALLLLCIAVGAWASDEDVSQTTAGLLIALFAAGMIALTEARRFGPAPSARLLAGAGLLFGLWLATSPYDSGSGLTSNLVLIAAGAGLIGLSLWSGSFIHMLTGVSGVFIGLVTLIFQEFEDDLGAPVALMISGALLIGAALLLGLAGRRHLREERSDA